MRRNKKRNVNVITCRIKFHLRPRDGRVSLDGARFLAIRFDLKLRGAARLSRREVDRYGAAIIARKVSNRPFCENKVKKKERKRKGKGKR